MRGHTHSMTTCTSAKATQTKLLSQKELLMIYWYIQWHFPRPLEVEIHIGHLSLVEITKCRFDIIYRGSTEKQYWKELADYLFRQKYTWTKAERFVLNQGMQENVASTSQIFFFKWPHGCVFYSQWPYFPPNFMKSVWNLKNLLVLLKINKHIYPRGLSNTENSF